MTGDQLSVISDQSLGAFPIPDIWSPITSPLHGDGAIAQLGERVLCKHEVVGSIPSGSTKFWRATAGDEFGAAAGRLPFPIRCNFISSFVEARERVEKR